MANKTIYSIGQYRSKNNIDIYKKDFSRYQSAESTETPCIIVDSDANKDGIQTSVAITNDAEKSNFRDKAIVIKNGYNNGNGLSKNKTYFLRAKILKHVAHDIVYNIKLINTSPSENSNAYKYNENDTYQHIKKVTVTKGGDSNTKAVKEILIGKCGDNFIASMMPHRSDVMENGQIINQGNNNSDCLTNIIVSEDSQIYRYNDSSLDIDNFIILDIDVSQIEQSSNNNQQYYVVEILFKPQKDGFNTIIFEKERTALDYNTKFTENGNEYYGLHTEVIDPIVYEVTNLLGGDNTEIPHRALNKIGVWGHSGLCMSINGEEIRIGSRGYYELNIEDFEITELGFVVEDSDKDRFLVDYEYTVSE